MPSLLVVLTVLLPAVLPGDALEPWASKHHPQDSARRHEEAISAARHEYRIQQGGTMDGANCRSPIGGGFAICEQTWESNRAVRLENVGDADLINPWLSNGRNNFRTVGEIVSSAVRPGMSDREKAVALWRLQTTHRFHATTNDNEVNDPVKVFNVYGYTTCGNDSICLAGLWRAAGFRVRPARCVGHCISQVEFDGRWNLLDGDMGPFYLLRDNVTIAGERDLVRDHDLLKRSHTNGILDPDSRVASENSAALFVAAGDWPGSRDSVRDTTMNMVLRPHEALVWRWGHLVPLKYHGRADIRLWGPRSEAGKSWGGDATDRICNGLWEYRPDFTRDLWRKGAEKTEHVKVEGGELTGEPDNSGVIVWRMRSPYVFVGGRLDVESSGARFSLSWDGVRWQEIDDGLDAFFHFPNKGDARYEYWLKCELPAGARLKRLLVRNDLQMAPLALPEMVVGENRFTYSDESPGERRVRVTHEWVERSFSAPPAAPPAPLFPADGGETEGTAIVFRWRPALAVRDAVADYHFELADRSDMAWPLSANFEKLVSNTADRVQAKYALPSEGLLVPGRVYFWRVRARNDKGVWGPWSKIWSFTAGGPAQPVGLTLVPVEASDGALALRWKPNSVGRPPAKYRIYGSDEMGFSVSDRPHRIQVGKSKDVPAECPANFVAETDKTELIVLSAGLGLPNANKAFYRVVAVDDRGQRSGPSDYAAAPRPFISSSPPVLARVGAEFRHQLSSIRSLGDLRLRIIDGKEVTGFWDVERPRFRLSKGPAWLKLDESAGVLHGVPGETGEAEVVLTVAMERPVRRLDDSRLSWGHELVTETRTDIAGAVMHRFRLRIEE